MTKGKIDIYGKERITTLNQITDTRKKHWERFDLKKLVKLPNSIAAIELKTKYGILETQDNKIINFREKKEISETWMNAGIYHLQKKILKELPVKGDIEKTLFPDFAKKGKLNTIKFKNTKWYSVDSFKDMEDCALEIKKIISLNYYLETQVKYLVGYNLFCLE